MPESDRDAPTPDREGPAGGPVDPDEPEEWPAPAPERRQFLHRLGLLAAATVGAVMTVPWLAVVISPARRDDPDAWRSVGRLEDFPVGEPQKVTYLDVAPLPWAGFVARDTAWVRREEDDRFLALASYCSHVGCPVRWEDGSRLFMCPCHGGAFYSDGSVAAGPPPRPLARYPVRVRDGVVEIQVVGVQTS